MLSLPTFCPFSMVLCSPFHCSCGCWGWHLVFLQQKDELSAWWGFSWEQCHFHARGFFFVSLRFHLGLFHMFSYHSLLPLPWLSGEVWNVCKLLRSVRPFPYVVFLELGAVPTWPPHNYLEESSGHKTQRIYKRTKLLISAVSQNEASHVFQNFSELGFRNALLELGRAVYLKCRF